MADRQDVVRQEAETLWRVNGFGQERHAPGGSYWFENRERDSQTVVFQHCLSGLIHFRDQRRAIHQVLPGHAVLFMHGEDSAYGIPRGATEPFVTQFIGLAGAGVREHWALLRRQGSVIAVDPEGPVLPALRKLMDLASPRSGCDAATMAMELHAFVMLLFTSLRQAHVRAQTPVERAVDDLLRHATAPWSLKQLAERHGVSREHLTRSFRQRLGVSPAAYLAKARLEKALELLRETTVPVAQVARQAGFSSTHTLARQVRAATGGSPRAVRRKEG